MVNLYFDIETNFHLKWLYYKLIMFMNRDTLVV